MKNRNFNRVLAADIIFALAAGMLLPSCGSGEAEITTADTTAAETAEVIYADYGGMEFRVLNFDQLWNMCFTLDSEEMTGEPLNDAIYLRNRQAEEKLNFKFVEKKYTNSGNDEKALINHAKTSIMAGDDEWDVMYLPIKVDIDLITGGYLTELSSLPELNLDAEWWDAGVNAAMSYKGRLYTATGALHLMAYDCTPVLLFNENMVADLKLELPYDAVRAGEWTVERMISYCKAAASLNGDDNFSWKKDGQAVYGLSAHPSVLPRFVFAAGEKLADFDDGGNIIYSLGRERSFDALEKLGELLGTGDGTTIKASWDDFNAENGGYQYIFACGRAMFTNVELKATQQLRDMRDTFGVLPYPKLDEAQEEYTIPVSPYYFTIPSTCSNISDTAAIAEFLTRSSFESVLPVYNQTVVEQKGLRNEESIEMLNIIRKSRTVDIAEQYNLDGSFRSQLGSNLFAGDPKLASLLAQHMPAIEAQIEKLTGYLESSGSQAG